MRAWRFGVVALGVVVAGFACNWKSKSGSKGGSISASTPLPPIDLKPLPDAPTIDVAAEGLPGSDGTLAIVAARPQGKARGNFRPTITFNKPIVALETISQAKAENRPAPAKLDPAVEGEWRWLGSSSLEFVAKGLVPYATGFTVTVPAGLTAMDGTKLAKDYVYQFSTPAPELQRSEPPTGFRWMKPDATITLIFNQPVADLVSKLSLTAGGEQMALVVKKEVDVAQELRDSEKGKRTYERHDFEMGGFKNQQTRYEVATAKPLPLDKQINFTIASDLRGKQGPLTLGEAKKLEWRTYGDFKVTGFTACARSGDRGYPCAWGPLVVWTSNRADVASLKTLVTIEPKVEIDWDHAESSLPESWTGRDEPFVSLPGKFRPGTSYKVTIAAGGKDEFGQVAPAASGSIQTDDLEPSFEMGSSEALIEAGGDGALPVSSQNVKAVEVAVWPMTPSQMAAMLGTQGVSWRSNTWTPPGTPIRSSVAMSTKRNGVATRPIPVRDLLAKKGTLFVVEGHAPEVDAKRGSRWVDRVAGQVTDLAVHAKLGATSGLVWVTKLSDGTSVADASVVLWDGSGTKRWEGKTGADGLVKTKGLAEFVSPDEERRASYTAPYALVSATKGDDTGVTVSQWTGGFSAWEWSISQDWDGKRPKSLGFVTPERGIYRPGEKVYVKGLARYRTMGEIRTPGTDSKLALSVTSSQGKTVFEKTVSVTEFGTFSASFDLPLDASLGTYDVRADGDVSEHGIAPPAAKGPANNRRGSSDDPNKVSYYGSFRMEEFRAPQFKVDVTSANKNYSAGDDLSATVLARYLFGGAMPEAAVKWSVNRSSTTFTPPGNDGFTFGNNVWDWNDDTPSQTYDFASSGEGKTDAMGALALALGKADAPSNKPWQYTVEAEVADVSRQRVANRVVFDVHPASVYAGIRSRATGFGEVGKAVAYEVVAADFDGKRQNGTSVALKATRREWKWIRKKGVGDRWYYESETSDTDAGSGTVSTDATAVTWQFTPKDPGYYVISATATDSQGRKSTTRDSIYVIGNGWVSWQRNDSDRLDLVADKSSYEPGQTAKILVKSPYPEAEAVLTVEREGVLSSKRVKLTGSAQSLEVPIDESLIPNAFIGVVLVRGRVAADKGVESGDDPGRPGVRVGYAQIHVEKKSKRLNVAITPDSKDKRPRDNVKLDIAVTDYKGKGTRAEVAVWAVDEGVLRLTGYEVPDPVAALHPDRGLSVRIGEPLIHLVAKRQYGEKGEPTGGSGGKDSTGSDVRRDFRTTWFFEGDKVTGADGKLHVEFKLPDNLTTFRIMAIAVTPDDRVGNGQSEVVVSKPLLAMPSLPRLARVGDKFEAGVVVHSPGGKVASVEVKAELEGLTLRGPATATVSMADGKPKEVRFKIEAEKPGTALLRFRVTGGGETDALEQKIPVQLPVVTEAVAVYGDTKDTRTEGLVPPAGVRTDVGGLDVSMSSTILGGFDENMKQLVDYPYGCLEQMSSRLIPFVELRKIHSKFGIAYTGPDGKKLAEAEEMNAWITSWLGGETLDIYGTRDPDVVIAKTLTNIQHLANHDGGFKYWADSSCSDEWSTSYAVIVLSRAKDVGYKVDAKILADAQNYLANTVAAGKCTRCGWFCVPPDDATRAFALYALARTGKPKASYYPELFARRGKLPLFAQAMLADAMYVGGGDRAQAKTLFTELLNHSKESEREVHFEETDSMTYAAKFSSDPRTTAIILQTLTDIAPDHPYVSKIGNYLTKVRQGNGRFRNTQEAAFALMALDEVVATKEKDTPDFTATVALAGKSLVEKSFRGRSTGIQKEHVDMAKMTAMLTGAAAGPKGLPFDFKKSGAGVLYYGAILKYAPAQMPMDKLEHGIVVQRWFEPYEGGGQVTTVRAGELVRIRVRVATHMERQYVVVDVPLPSGLEAIDTSLASSAQFPTKAGQEQSNRYEYESNEDTYADGRSGEYGDGDESYSAGGNQSFEEYAGWFWSPFNHVERRDDRVVLFADHMPPGVHTSSFVARATTIGDFVMKPAKAEEMYTPEVFGRSEGGVFRVIESNEVAGK